MQIALAGACLGRNNLVVGDGHENAIDIGKLPAGAVDAMVVGVALKDEAVGRRPRLEDPWLERRQVRIVVSVGVVDAIVERRPVALFALLDELLEFFLVGIFGVG